MSTTVDDAQQQADLLTELINSLPTASDPNIIRPEIQTEALTLHGMELALVGPAEQAAQAAAAAEFDALVNWDIGAVGSSRLAVINAAKSAQPIIELGMRIRGWPHVLGRSIGLRRRRCRRRRYLIIWKAIVQLPGRDEQP